MALNRAGHWAEAAVLAERLLAAPGAAPLAERCETRYSLGYAYAKTGRRPAARAELTRVLRECASLTGHWMLGEARRMADELDPERVARPTVRADDGWATADPTALGVDTAALAEHRRLCQASGADACLVAVRGRIVQEWYGSGYAEPMATMSSVKSWTALLAGLLIADGKLRLDDPVARWIPEWKSGVAAGVTVRHLLTMTSGLPENPPQSVGAVRDKNAFVFGRPLVARPGERWAYSNEGVQLLSPILERAAGMPLQEFARRRLFEPLRMRDTELRLDPAGHAWTYADAKTTLRDFAKVCQLALDGGRFQGTQVVPEAWMRLVTQPIPQNAGYGMLWWLERDPVVHASRGYLNTDCYAMPELGLVVARMQSHARPDVARSYGTSSDLTPDVEALYRRIARPE